MSYLNKITSLREFTKILFSLCLVQTQDFKIILIYINLVLNLSILKLVRIYFSMDSETMFFKDEEKYSVCRSK